MVKILHVAMESDMHSSYINFNNMKKLVYGGLSLAAVGITILACKKEILKNSMDSTISNNPAANTSSNTDKILGIPGTGFLDSILTSPLGIDITFGVKCKIARKITIRP